MSVSVGFTFLNQTNLYCQPNLRDRDLATTIASRFGGNTYSYRESFANEYKANLDSELILLNLHNNKEYIYTFEVTYAEGADSFTPDSTITVIVKGKKPLFSN